jgi:nucleoside diphosphate kinase
MDGRGSEITPVFVKPGNENIASEVFGYLDYLLEQDGIYFFRSPCTCRISNLPIEFMEKLYVNTVGKLPQKIIEKTFEAYNNGTIFFKTYLGENIIQRVVKNVGDTDPVKAADWTVRGRFRMDSLEAAFKEQRYLNNTIHAPKTLEEASEQMKLWLGGKLNHNSLKHFFFGRSL